ncbi:MAG: anthranilate synthase component I family protein [Christensenellales bacterium]|jgi:anthranilate synthase component 1
MITPRLQEAKALARENSIVPVAMEMFSDVKTSIEILKNIRRNSDFWYILESVSGGDNWGRYSFLGYDPAMTVSCEGGVLAVKNGISETVEDEDPIGYLKALLARYRSPRIEGLPPFTGGLVGYFAYDFAQHFIPGLKLRAADAEGFKDFHLMLMDKVVAFDHFRQKIYLMVNVPAKDMDTGYIRAVTQLKDMQRMILDDLPSRESPSICGQFTASFTKEQFEQMVLKVKHHITEGDIFQAVVSNRFTADFRGDLMQTYRVLRTTNPSPYMVYMRLDDMEIACSSPETLVSLQGGEISSFPLAGTCSRGKTLREDEALAEALLNDQKELAEHDMLVDLARNDVGKVSRFGSVQVRAYRQIKRFSHVSHIASHVTGELREGLDAIDVIAATLPAGTLSGAPKKRACEIIDDVESIKRGVYGGAIGYIDFAGNMDMCIGIRMAVLKDGRVSVQSGAGIVAASVPEKEYRETQNKARAVIEALQYAEEV